MRDKPTREKALALLEALVGNIDIGEQQWAPKSPHAVTHFEAALGRGSLLYPDALERLASEPTATARKYRDSAPGSVDHRIWAKDNAELDSIEAKRDAFLDLIQGYIDALRPAEYGTCATCGNWAERTGEHAPDGFRGDWSVCLRLVEAHVMDTGRLRAVPTAPTFSCCLWCPEGGDAR